MTWPGLILGKWLGINISVWIGGGGAAWVCLNTTFSIGFLSNSKIDTALSIYNFQKFYMLYQFEPVWSVEVFRSNSFFSFWSDKFSVWTACSFRRISQTFDSISLLKPFEIKLVEKVELSMTHFDIYRSWGYSTRSNRPHSFLWMTSFRFQASFWVLQLRSRGSAFWIRRTPFLSSL